MKNNKIYTLIILLLLGAANAKQGEIQGKKNRTSFRFGYLIGAINSGHFPLVLNYERFFPTNISLGGSLGNTVISNGRFNDYSVAEISVRRFFFGEYQRIILSASAFLRYDRRFNKETSIALPFKTGYLWQWSKLFTSIEGGLGPGIYTNQNMNGYEFKPDIVEAYWNLGFVF